MPHYSIDTFEVAGSGFNPLDSPRSLEAALRRGVDLDELYPRQLSYFLSSAGNKESLARVLADHYESRRKDYVNEVRAERKRILAEEARVRAQAAKLLAMLGETLKEEEGGGVGVGVAGAGAPGGTANALHDLVMAQGRARIEAERKRMDKQKQKAAKELENRLAGEKLIDEKAARDRELMDAKAAAANEARKERMRRAKKEADMKRAAEEDKLRDAEARDAETRKMIAIDFEKEKLHREHAAAMAKALLVKRKGEEEEARASAIEADRAREEAAEARADALKVSTHKRLEQALFLLLDLCTLRCFRAHPPPPPSRNARKKWPKKMQNDAWHETSGKRKRRQKLQSSLPLWKSALKQRGGKMRIT